ncbi:MAG: hypothetical protein GW760_02390 [Legionella sp.]|jgi:hypothetical protein|nr:hypothetical protein [Legionella sp.]
MFKRCWVWGLALSAMLLAQGVMAFPCFITITKDSCWTQYTVMVDVLDAETDAILTTVVIPQGESWSRARIDAKAKQHVMLRAKFKPVFWKSEKNKIYYAKQYWLLPDAIEGQSTAVHVSVCYPKSFSGVPLPPGADSKCICSKPALPKVSD